MSCFKSAGMTWQLWSLSSEEGEQRGGAEEDSSRVRDQEATQGQQDKRFSILHISSPPPPHHPQVWSRRQCHVELLLDLLRAAAAHPLEATSAPSPAPLFLPCERRERGQRSQTSTKTRSPGRRRETMNKSAHGSKSSGGSHQVPDLSQHRLDDEENFFWSCANKETLSIERR
eukprot:757279-Hanusia_phi.AAC.6